MDLLVIYETNPEKVFSFVVKEDDSRYSLLSQAHGLMVNGNNKEYPEDVVDLLCDISMEDIDSSENSPPLEISGSFKVIHCGFIL